MCIRDRVCTDEQQMPELKRLYENGIANGVPGLRIVSGSELRQMEPHLSDTVVAAIYAPTGGIVCPFELKDVYKRQPCWSCCCWLPICRRYPWRFRICWDNKRKEQAI